jgi:hypothetical protein
MTRYIKPIGSRPADRKYVDAKLRRIVASDGVSGGHMHSSLLGCLEGMICALSAAPTSADRATWTRRASYFVSVITTDRAWADAYRSKGEDDFVADRFCDLDLNADEREQL